MSALYKHYRGGMYSQLLHAKASGSIKEGEMAIIYISLQDGELWVRSVSEFNDIVRSDEGLIVGPMRYTKLTGLEVEKEVKKRNKKLGIKPRVIKR